MVRTRLYIEGGESKEDQIRCREGFRKLFEQAGFTGRMPRLTASGGRDAAFGDFKTAHAGSTAGHYVAMLVDSEDPVVDIERPWTHLKGRDGWVRPSGTVDEQVLLMTTCMETWIVADREALRRHYRSALQESALPPLVKLEARERADVRARSGTPWSRTMSRRRSPANRAFRRHRAPRPQSHPRPWLPACRAAH